MRIFLALLFLLISGQCFGADYWVYIRLTDRIGDTVENNAGRSKAGDIVQVLAVTPTNTPTETEKSEWFIVKVLNVSDALYQMAMQAWSEEQPDGTTKKIAYRRHKLKLSALKIKSTGLYPTSFNASKISNNLAQKTSSDLTKYEAKRIYLAMQKPCVLIAKSLASVLVQTAYASSEIVRKINCATEDYNTLTLWEDAKDGNIVSADQIQTAECYDDDGVLSDNVTLGGWTTDASRYWKIYTPTSERHKGNVSSGFTLKASAAATVITTGDSTGYIDGLIIDGNNANAAIVYIQSLNQTQYVKNCIIHNSQHYGVNNAGSSAKTIAWNLIIYNVTRLWHAGDTASTTQKLYNCTGFSKSSYGYVRPVCINSYAGGATTANYLQCGTGTDYIVSSDATADDFSNTHYATGENSYSDYFVSTVTATADYHLKNTSLALWGIDGSDQSSIFTTDIDGDTWTTWGIGADMYVAASPPAAAVPSLIQWQTWEN